MHGHSFKVEIHIEGEVDPAIGWVYDHKRISDAMGPLIDRMDHSYLNDIEGLESPTIEVMAAWFGESWNLTCRGCVRLSSTKPRQPAVPSEANFESGAP